MGRGHRAFRLSAGGMLLLRGLLRLVLRSLLRLLLGSLLLLGLLLLALLLFMLGQLLTLLLVLLFLLGLDLPRLLLRLLLLLSLLLPLRLLALLELFPLRMLLIGLLRRCGLPCLGGRGLRGLLEALAHGRVAGLVLVVLLAYHLLLLGLRIARSAVLPLVGRQRGGSRRVAAIPLVPATMVL